MPTVDSRLPRYQRLRDDMLSRIASGAWVPGVAIPNEAQLAEQYHVAIGTVRRAVDTLVNDGLLERSQGRGTFVRRPSFDSSLVRFFRQIDTSGPPASPCSTVLSNTVNKPSDAICEALDLETGSPSIHLRRLRTLGNTAVSVDEIWLPVNRFAALRDISPHEFGSLLYPFYEAQCGQLIASARETLTVVTATADTPGELNVPDGAPVVHVERLARGYDGTPLEYRRTWGNAATFRYQVDIN